MSWEWVTRPTWDSSPGRMSSTPTSVAIPGGLSVVATFTMPAANGDNLYGKFTSVGHFANATTLVIHGNYQFTGGTGRVAEATGSIDASAFLLPGLPFERTFTGTINY